MPEIRRIVRTAALGVLILFPKDIQPPNRASLNAVLPFSQAALCGYSLDQIALLTQYGNNHGYPIRTEDIAAITGLNGCAPFQRAVNSPQGGPAIVTPFSDAPLPRSEALYATATATPMPAATMVPGAAAAGGSEPPPPIPESEASNSKTRLKVIKGIALTLLGAITIGPLVSRLWPRRKQAKKLSEGGQQTSSPAQTGEFVPTPAFKRQEPAQPAQPIIVPPTPVNTQEEIVTETVTTYTNEPPPFFYDYFASIIGFIDWLNGSELGDPPEYQNKPADINTVILINKK